MCPIRILVYFHRIGRTARAGAEGKAITFVSYSSVSEWNLIKRQIKVELTDLNKEMGIEVNIPDPLKRQVVPTQVWNAVPEWIIQRPARWPWTAPRWPVRRRS